MTELASKNEATVPTLSEMRFYFDSFLLYQRSIKNSAATLVFYRRYIADFLEFLETSGLPGDLRLLTPTVIRTYLVGIQETNKRGSPRLPRTVHAYARAVRAFVNWACFEADIPSPMAKVKMPSLPDAWKVKTFSPVEVEALFDACAKTTPGQRLRNTAILSVLLDSGIRAKELLNLHFGDIAPDGSFSVPSGKSRQPRTTRLGVSALKAVRAYLHYERGSLPGALFLVSEGKPLTYSALVQMLGRLKEIAGIEIAGSAHICRHTAATAMHNNGMPPSVLQEILGHAKFQTTNDFYLDITDNDVRRSHALYSPLDNMPTLSHKGGSRAASKLPSPQALLAEVAASSYRAVGRKYNVSDTTIRNYINKGNRP